MYCIACKIAKGKPWERVLALLMIAGVVALLVLSAESGSERAGEGNAAGPQERSVEEGEGRGLVETRSEGSPDAGAGTGAGKTNNEKGTDT